MTPIRLLAISACSLAIVSCANKSSEDHYDTGANPYGTPDSQGTTAQQAVNPPANASANPTYDTPAAYEESSSAPAAPESAIVDPGLSAPRTTPGNRPAKTAATAAAATPAAHAAAGGAVHVVVAGDTLGGIARKYGVTQSAIKQANNMTKDTVVLGKKLVIPAR